MACPMSRQADEMAGVDDVAEWMASEVETMGFLYEETAVADIAKRFGEEFVHADASGHRSVSKAVLDAFHRLTAGTIIWDRWDKCWRDVELGYPPGPPGPHERPIS